MDKLLSMQVFREVVERGGFARAAEHLNMAPSAVTRHVAALEHRLGTPLLVRTTRSLTLTERGEIFLERVRGILADVEDAEATVGSATTAYTGMLRISVPVVYGLYFLPALLLRFQKQYPNIQFDIMLSDDPVDFVASGRELCLAFSENVTHADTVTRRFGSARTVLCATPDYLKNSPPLDGIDDLARHRCLVVKAHRSWGDTWHLRAADGEMHSFPVVPAIACDSSAMVYESVLTGLGIGRLPVLLAADALAERRLVQVLEAFESPDAELVLAYPGRSYLTSRARVFIDFVLAHVPGAGASDKDDQRLPDTHLSAR